MHGVSTTENCFETHQLIIWKILIMWNTLALIQINFG